MISIGHMVGREEVIVHVTFDALVNTCLEAFAGIREYG